MSFLRSILERFSRKKRGRKKHVSGKAFSPKQHAAKRERTLRLKKYAIAIAVVGAVYFIYDLPSTAPLAKIKKSPSITVKAEDGTVLGTYGDIYGDYIPYDQL